MIKYTYSEYNIVTVVYMLLFIRDLCVCEHIINTNPSFSFASRRILSHKRLRDFCSFVFGSARLKWALEVYVLTYACDFGYTEVTNRAKVLNVWNFTDIKIPSAVAILSKVQYLCHFSPS